MKGDGTRAIVKHHGYNSNAAVTDFIHTHKSCMNLDKRMNTMTMFSVTDDASLGALCDTLIAITINLCINKHKAFTLLFLLLFVQSA